MGRRRGRVRRGQRNEKETRVTGNEKIREGGEIKEGSKRKRG